MADRTHWDAEAHQALLVAVMTQVTLTNDEWENKVAPQLRAKGYNYTYKAAMYSETHSYFPTFSTFQHNYPSILPSIHSPLICFHALHLLLSIPYINRNISTFNNTNPAITVMETPSKGFKWDHEAERDLFGACLVVLGEPKGQTLAKARELLQEVRGVTYTLKAAQHRMSDISSRRSCLS